MKHIMLMTVDSTLRRILPGASRRLARSLRNTTPLRPAGHRTVGLDAAANRLGSGLGLGLGLGQPADTKRPHARPVASRMARSQNGTIAH